MNSFWVYFDLSFFLFLFAYFLKQILHGIIGKFYLIDKAMLLYFIFTISVSRKYNILFYMLFLAWKGLVRSPISATLPQISSRLYVVWGILYSFPEVRQLLSSFKLIFSFITAVLRGKTWWWQVQTHPIVSSLVISWCITEVRPLFLFFPLSTIVLSG